MGMGTVENIMDTHLITAHTTRTTKVTITIHDTTSLVIIHTHHTTVVIVKV